MQVRVEVQGVSGCLQRYDGTWVACRENSGEEFFEGSPGGIEQERTLLSVVLKERAQAFRQREDHVAVGDGSKHARAEVLGEDDRALCGTGRADATLLAGERYQSGVVTFLAAGPRATVRKEPAVKVGVEGGEHFVAQAPVLGLVA